uniref:SWIM-type domain-containing protein n=1 Tax=Fagus sylvatica TaxID=28930 RepID=A0A2N9HBF3_FAGSY
MDDDDFFIFEIHFGGRFKNLNGLLESILGKYGYQRGDLIYYKLTDMSLDNGLVLLKTDNDVLKMVDVHKTEKFVVLYTVSAADADDCIPLTPTLPEVLVVDKSNHQSKGKRRKWQIGVKAKGKREDSLRKEYDADDDVDCANFDNDNEAGLEVEDEDSELDLWDGLLSGDEDLLDAVVAAYSQGMASQPASQPACETASQPASQTVTEPASKTVTAQVREPEFKKDWDSEKPNSDELISPLATSDEEKGPKPKSVEFHVMGMSNPVLENGMKFADVYQFREAMREYNLKIGKDLSFVKNDKDKIAKKYMETFRHDIQKPIIALQQEIKVTRTGFKEGCRPLIGLDGCFLKGSYKGHLLSVVSRDANDNMYPICVAVVESECKASWSWACVRHIYANFRDSGHRGKALKDKLWAAASAYTEFEFDAHMAELKKLSPPTYEYLSKIPVATWSRSKFTKNPKSDLIVNNLSECFNSYILDARDKPILTMLDTIRRKLMRRFQVNRASIAKMSGKLCPKIQVKVEKAGVKASECLLMYSGEGKYEVDYRQQKFVVNLREKTCGCKKWDITGIPCHHAISAILHEGSKIEDYVDHCYTIEKYKKSYEPIIHPVPSMEQWTQTQYDPVDPPLERCHPGRPKRQRKRDPIEPSNPYRFSKLGTNIKCSVCKKLGHNSRTCPLAKKKKSKIGSKGKKKSTVTVGAGTNKKGAVTSGQAATCGRLAFAGDATGSAGGATGTAGATGTGAATGTVNAAGIGSKGKKKSVLLWVLELVEVVLLL